MSAPDTNTSTEERRHKPALLGIRGAMVFGALMLIGLIGFNLANVGDGEAVMNTSEDGPVSTVPATDVYEPGTNSSSTPTATD